MILVSNALKPQRRTSITGLTSATKYVVKLEAHNVAGFSTEEFSFTTLTKDGGMYVWMRCVLTEQTFFF